MTAAARALRGVQLGTTPGRKTKKYMAVNLRPKSETIADMAGAFGLAENDTGSPEIQIALLSERISHLTDHMKAHKKDHHTRRGLQMLVGKRRRLLDYVKDNDVERYRAVIAHLGLRR
jgi:small subunit ribosomal protein S15